MLDELNKLFTLPFWVLVIIIGLTATAIKELFESIFNKVEKVVPDNIDHWIIRIWNNVVVRILPISIGGLIGYLVTAYPYPEPFNTSAFARFCIGTVAGLVSLFTFPRILVYLKGLAKTKEQEKEQDVADILTSDDSK